MGMGDTEQTVATNLARVRESIAETALRVGRNPTEIKLIAVSKTQPIVTIEDAIAAGQTVFGENTVQEALPKIDALRDRGLEWHFIGHLQSNKAKFIPGNFSWVHSLDSLKLAERLSQAALSRHEAIQALIEVNITRDPEKHGIAPEALQVLVEQLLKAGLTGIALRGLMAIGPHPASEPEIHQAFADLRRLRDTCRQRSDLAGFNELSMGMSGDYMEAIEEGSTMVRVGTAIFGGRNKSK
jgi:pyridoxal phosphate enzyme (YggS family)